jgi:hypothetical protein
VAPADFGAGRHRDAGPATPAASAGSPVTALSVKSVLELGRVWDDMAGRLRLT